MPRNTDPGKFSTGPGETPKQSVDSAVQSNTIAANSHLLSSSSAHGASSITIDAHPPAFDASNVDGALDELSGLIPPRPPQVGMYQPWNYTDVSGIPDWGILKQADSRIDVRTGNPVGFDVSGAYGYLYSASDPAITDPPFLVTGDDPLTDPVFNIAAVGYPGGGEGASHAGGYTDTTDNKIVQTNRIVEFSASQKQFIVSGMVYPADRGVLALLAWPSGGDMAAFIAQPLTTRCPAALLLGNGLSSSSGGSTGCDGLGGGMFTPGSDAAQDFDPYAFPGSATGQFDLDEIHTGINNATGGALPAEFLPADNTAGQVRLGSNAASGVVVAGGVPILGGSSAANGGGSDDNFFRYRLPYSNDYGGLKFVPSSEKIRYFGKPSISDNPSVDLSQAGNYPDFDQSYWPFQIARYRHQVDMSGLAGSPRFSGSFILLHFRREEYFESMVRDGLAPTALQLFSANLSDWTSPEAPENIALDDLGNENPIASGYHILRAAVVEDTLSPLTTGGGQKFNFSQNSSYISSCSGVRYFTSGGGPNKFEIINFSGKLFPINNTYLTGESEVSTGGYLRNRNPLRVSLAPFSYGLDGVTPTYEQPSSPSLSDPASRKRQGFDLELEDMGYNFAVTPPVPAAQFTLGFASIVLSGDQDLPSFSQDSRLQLIGSEPVGHGSLVSLNTSISVPYSTGDAILFHSSTVDPTGADFGGPSYLNVVIGSVTPTTIQKSEKDTEERFLDEAYRFRSNDPTDPWGINGPGLAGAPSPIDVGTRDADWLLPNEYHVIDLSTGAGDGEAQVSGLPERSPASTEGIFSDPYPSAGLLIYPQTDYSTSHRPNITDTALVQPDYSGLTIGASGDRSYVRIFDAEFSRSGSPRNVEGQAFFTMRLRGIQLAEFEYQAGVNAISLFVKIPGFTTWMDIGRVDGDGPSKQDVNIDGAGCKVIGAETFDGINANTGEVYSEVSVHIGPIAVLFKNTAGEVPIAFKATIRDTAAGRNLNFTQGGATGAPSLLRGLIGVEIV